MGFMLNIVVGFMSRGGPPPYGGDPKPRDIQIPRRETYGLWVEGLRVRVLQVLPYSLQLVLYLAHEVSPRWSFEC